MTLLSRAAGEDFRLSRYMSFSTGEVRGVAFSRYGVMDVNESQREEKKSLGEHLGINVKRRNVYQASQQDRRAKGF